MVIFCPPPPNITLPPVAPPPPFQHPAAVRGEEYDDIQHFIIKCNCGTPFDYPQVTYPL